MIDYYDRQGQPLTLENWAALMSQRGWAYKRVAEVTLPNGHRISTIWLGLNHRHGGDGPPLIFETMVFDALTNHDLDMARYSTEAEALAGHQRMVEKWTLRGH
jgi:hypothetical protein